MKDVLIKVSDTFCSIIWKILIFANKVASYFLLMIGKILYALWIVLSFIWPINKIAPDINKFFKGFRAFLKPYLKQLSKHYQKFLNDIDKSAVAKRICVPILIILVSLAIYPPSHWGPWKLREQGIASYYGYGFYFRQTASGERYYPWDITAASLTLPLGSIAKIINKNNGNVVYVRINDRGPYVNGRILDLSFVAAMKLGMINHGVIPVDIYTRD